MMKHVTFITFYTNVVFNNSDAGIEIRDAGFVVAVDTEISYCGSQGLISHAGALGYALHR
jgi:hypothetical protein